MMNWINDPAFMVDAATHAFDAFLMLVNFLIGFLIVALAWGD